MEDFQTVSDVKHMSPKAKIYCVVGGILEDMKQGSRSIFIGGKLSDKDTSIRVYRYNPEVRVGSSQPEPKRSAQSS